MLMTRIVSALVVIVAVVGIVVWAPPWATVAAAALVAAIGSVELARLTRPLGVTVTPAFVAVSAIGFCLALAGNFPVASMHRDVLVVLVIGLTIAAGLVTLASHPPGPPVFASIAVMLLAGLYVGMPLGAMAWVRTEHGPAALIWLLSVIAVGDSAQFAAGKLWGRRKLSPVVSPGKTVEGAIGGLVVSPLVGVVLGWWALPDSAWPVTGVLALGLALFGMAGDLFESLLKRSVGAKDSSALMPGHGGVLDRIDAYLFAGPVFYLFLRYVA